MMPIKARLIVEGNVQGVGYRALVKQVARRLKIRGKVRNLDDGTVEIYCEGDKDTIQRFIKAIEIKSKEPENVFALNVENIDVNFEGEKGYVPLNKEMGFFEIEYGEEAKSVFEKANLERLEIGSLILSSVGEKVDAVGKNVIEVGGKIDTGFSQMDSNFQTLGGKVDAVGEKVDTGFSKTDSNFKDLDGKYDVVSRELKSINENISKLVGYLGALVEEFVKKKRGMKKRCAAVENV